MPRRFVLLFSIPILRRFTVHPEKHSSSLPIDEFDPSSSTTPPNKIEIALAINAQTSNPHRTSSVPGIFTDMPCPCRRSGPTVYHHGTGVSFPSQPSSSRQVSPGAQLLSEYQQQVCAALPEPYRSSYTLGPDLHSRFYTPPVQPKVESPDLTPLSTHAVASCFDIKQQQQAEPSYGESPLPMSHSEGIATTPRRPIAECGCGWVHMMPKSTPCGHHPYFDISMQTMSEGQPKE